MLIWYIRLLMFMGVVMVVDACQDFVIALGYFSYFFSPLLVVWSVVCTSVMWLLLGLRYQLIRVQARGFGENCKWLEMFEDVRIVIFCVALSDYDQYAMDGDGALANKMLLSKKFFEYIVTHPTFDQMDFLLILNKFDLFEEKIERVPLTQCDWFNDFHPLISRSQRSHSSSNSNNINSNPSLGQLAFHYTAVKFKGLYSSLTDRKLYVAPAKGLEPKSVDEALKYAREILKWEEERSNFSLSEYSIYSTEASTSSHWQWHQRE